MAGFENHTSIPKGNGHLEAQGREILQDDGLGQKYKSTLRGGHCTEDSYSTQNIPQTVMDRGTGISGQSLVDFAYLEESAHGKSSM